MRRYARVGLAAAAAVGMLLAIVGCEPHNNNHDASSHWPWATSSDAPSSSPSPANGYVALGDSYTAGLGIPAQTGGPAGCGRSDHNYPALVAQELDLQSDDFRDLSCSGATIADLSAAETTNNGVNPAQFSALSTSTDLVTIGIGGNDIDFSSLVKQCAEAGVLYYATGDGDYGGVAPCRQEHVSGGADDVQARIRTAGEHLASALTEVKHLAPNARVYVVGYPAILPPNGSECGREMGLAAGDVTFLYQKEQQLNTVLRQRAKAAGVEYVDTYTPSVGRDACSAPETRWVEPWVPLSPAAPVHPNARGASGMADAVLHAIKS